MSKDLCAGHGAFKFSMNVCTNTYDTCMYEYMQPSMTRIYTWKFAILTDFGDSNEVPIPLLQSLENCENSQSERTFEARWLTVVFINFAYVNLNILNYFFLSLRKGLSCRVA